MPLAPRPIVVGFLLSPIVAQSLAIAPQARPVHVGSPAAFDPFRQRLVMFGDEGTTWELVGGEVLPRATVDGAPTPPPRVLQAMCFDEARRRVLMFGGQNANNPMDDTWVYDGNRWTQLTSGPTPPPRSLAAMAWDANRNRAVMWGGGIADTWEHDGSSWQLRSPATAPAPNAGPMAFDRQRGVTVLVVPVVSTNETWEWNGANWALRATFGVDIYNPTMAFDPQRNRTVLVGGADNNRVWEWDGTNWTASPPVAQPFRRQHAASWFDPACGCVAIAGGSEYQVVGVAQLVALRNDLWQWNGQALTQLQSDRGPRASDGVMIPDPPRGRVVHFGGILPNLQSTAETWAFANGTWSAVPSAISPSPRRLAAGTHDLIRGESLLFGGDGGGVLLGDTWSLGGSGWVNRSNTGPAPRAQPAMAADLLRGVVVLFGGQGASPTNPALDDTWEWNGTLWTQRATTVQPASRFGAALAFHPQLGRLLLFGGRGLTNDFDDTWTWDGSQWSRLLPATTPPPLSSIAMSSELTGNRCILVGMDTFSPGVSRQQVWTHDGADWRLALDEVPPISGFWTPCASSARLDTMLCSHNGSPAAAAELTFTRGRVATIGAGCGMPPSALVARSRPRAGADNGLELTANPIRAVLFALDLASGNTPIGGACTLWLSPGFLGLFQVSDAAGFATQPLSLPAGALGLDLFAQAAVLEPLSSNGLVLTQGLRLTLGD